MKSLRPIVCRKPPAQSVIDALGSIDPLHARLFAMRGLTDAEQLDYGLARLAPVSSLEHVDEAANLLIAKRHERIIVIGDFDVCVACASSVLPMSTTWFLIGLSMAMD
jgi:single-stranded-DNA-specific exonuclease